jgi:glycogen operon protein
MLLAGDELGRTQYGNNNAYCQDNEISWLDWELDGEAAALLEFARRVVAVRQAHPVFRREEFLHPWPVHGAALPGVAYFGGGGTELSEAERSRPCDTLAVFMNGEAITEPGPQGEQILDDSFLLILNGPRPTSFRLPGQPWAETFEVVFDTALPDHPIVEVAGDAELALEGRSVVLLRRTG